MSVLFAICLFQTSEANELILRGGGGKRCADIFSGRPSSPSAEVLNIFRFPEEANYPLNDSVMRQAIYKAFKGKDFYTGREITFEEMVIDHVVPRALGGPDNVFNYVPTTSRINGAKSASFDEIAATGTLSAVRTIYAPKVLREIERAENPTPPRRVRTSGASSNSGVYRPRPGTKITRKEYGVRFQEGSSLETIAKIHEFVLVNRQNLKIQDGYAEITLDLNVWRTAFPEGIQSLLTSLDSISMVRTDVYTTGRKVEEVESGFLLGFGRNGTENQIPTSEGVLVVRFDQRIGEMFGRYEVEHLQTVLSRGSFLSAHGSWDPFISE